MRPALYVGLRGGDLSTRVIARVPVFVVLSAALLLSSAALAWANGTAQTLPFSQGWTDTGQLSRNNEWGSVPGINGYSGDFPFTAGSNPQTQTADGSPLGPNVTVDRTSPNTDASGGIAEFQISNPTVALQPTDSHDLPHLVMNLDTRSRKNVNVSYTLRDIDGSADNAAQQIMLQYRVGSSGNYTNLPAGYVADATAGPSLTKETKVSVNLPSAVEGQSLVQVRVGSANAVGNDEWVGVDDISVSSVPTVSVSGPASSNEGATQTYNYTVSDTDPGDVFSRKSGFPDCGTGGSLVSGSLQTGAAGGSFQCRFPDGSASPNVRVQIADSRNLDSNTASQAVSVANVAPTVSLSGPATANEGETKTYDFAVTDPGQDTFSVRSGFPDCGTGGSLVSGSLQTGAAGGSFQCRFPDGPASPTVRMQVADEDGAIGNTATRSVTVANVAPAVALNGPNTAEEGQTKSYTYSVSDPGDDPSPAFTEGCGQNGVRVNTPEPNDFGCRFPNGPATPTVSVGANDGDASNNIGSASQNVAVANVAPTASLTGPGAAEEGQTKTYTFEVSDPGEDTARFAPSSPSCGENGRLQGTPAFGDRSFRCAFPDGPATSTPTVRVADSDDAQSNAAGRDVTVSNVAPAVRLEGPTSAEEGQTKSYAYSVTDPGADPNPTVVESCGQGARQTDDPRENSFDCAFPDGPASPTVSVAATDEDGGRGDASVAVRVSNVAPTAADDPTDGAYETDEDANLQIGAGRGLISNDADRGADGLTARRISGPARGGVEIAADGSFVYRPNANFNGDDSFTYEACDEDSACSAPATVRVKVAAVNDAPVNDVPGAQEMEEDRTLTFSGARRNALSVSDTEGGQMRTTVETTDGSLELRDVGGGPVNGGVSAAGNGTSTVTVEGTADKIGAALDGLRFAPEENRNGATSLRVLTDDGGNAGSGGPLVDEDRIDVNISPVNDAPRISDVPDAATDEDTPSESIPFTVQDVDDPADELTLSGFSADNSLVPDSGIEFGGSGEDRTVRVTPAADRFGEVEITARVGDGEASDSDAFRLTVRDKTPPEPPALDLEADSDTGRSDTDDVTNDATPVVTGAAEAGSEVEVYDGGELLGAATVEDGGWRYEVPADRAFADGEHVITATATDAAGNTSERSGPLNVVVDRREPDTFVDGSPADHTKGEADVFRFSSDEADAEFECFVDDTNFEPCGPPKEYRDVAEGEHAFETRAVDRAGNVDPSPAMRTWTVDRTEPEVSISEPADGSLVRGEVLISADASDDRATETVEFLVDGEVVDTDRGPEADRDEPYEFGWDTSLEEDGTHTIAVRATDRAGNTAEAGPRTLRTDNTAPDTAVDYSPNDPTNGQRISFRFSSEDAGARFECSFGGSDFEGCSSPEEYQGAGSRPDGDYVFKVRAVDEAGNGDDSPAERSVTLDTRAPDAPTVERPTEGSLGNEAALFFEGTAEPDSRVKILELSENGEDVRATSRRAGEDGRWSVGFADVSDGQHRFAAVAIDRAGNESERSRTRIVTVDTAPPEVARVIPSRDRADAAINGVVEVVFSKKIQASTLEGNFVLSRGGAAEEVPAYVEYEASTNSATLRPNANLEYSTSHTVTVRGGEDGVKDLAGNPLAADETWSFTTAEEPDTRAPDAPEIRRPAEDAHDDDGAFAVSGVAEAGSRVRLFDESGTAVGVALAGSEDGNGVAGAWEVPLADVPEGRHAYEATATDSAANESGRSAPRAVVVDLTNPDTVIRESPDSFTNKAVSTFRFSSNEGGATFECRPKDGPFEPCASPQEYAGLSDGDYVFEVRAVDRAGNADPSPARRTFVVDTAAPEAGITSPATDALTRGEVRFTARADDDRGIERVEFLVDGDRVDSDLIPPYEFGWDSTLKPDGGHAVEVRVTDRAGNTFTSAPRSFRTDNAAPDTRITASPRLLTNDPRAAFGFVADEEGAGFECSLDDGAFEPCPSPTNYENLPDGEHLFSVRAVDAAGNRDATAAQRRVMVDTAAPAVGIVDGPTGTVAAGDARLTFSSEEGARLECRLDGGPFEVCSSPKEYPGLADGRHVFEARAADKAGNVGAVVGRAWTVQTVAPDTTAPTVTKVTPAGVRVFPKAVVAVTFSEGVDAATVNGSTFRLVKAGTRGPVFAKVRYDAATNRAILKPVRPLARGASYTATVTTGVKDAAGNPAAANKVWRFKVR